MNQPSESPGAVPPAPQPDPAHRPALLLVDDNQANLVALRAVLESLDVDIVEATSGDEALEQLLRREFAVVLMDVTKPSDQQIVKARVAAFVGAGRQERLLRRQAEALHAKEREAAREHAAREAAEAASRAKDDFLAMVSHELRAPLNAILGWSVMVEASHELPATLLKPVQTIARNARVQSQLIDDLLDVSRMVAGKLRVTPALIDFRAVVEAAIAAMRGQAAQAQLTLELEVAAGAYVIAGDRTRLEQVITNVVSNAIKFSRGDGRIEVRLERRDETVRLSVADDGIGIAPAFLPHVFERFRQAEVGTARQRGGLGIGLTLARSLVQLHRGAIEAQSRGEGQGATFTIELPALAATSVESAPIAPPAAELVAAPGVLEGLRVLVVDDDRDARELLAAVLSAAGATIVTAGSAAEAFAAVETTRFDAMTSDLGMPGEDGLSLMTRIRATARDRAAPLVAIAISGYGSAQDREQSERAGFGAHVVKPSEPSVIVALLARLTGRA